MNSPLVSIIVPVYNAEEYIEDCLVSLLNQDYAKLEIIVINDGSSDRSLDILLNLSNHDKRIKVINKKNEGVSAARNQALDLAVGEYTMFVDADDWLDLTTVSQCVQAISLHGADVCLFAYMREFNDSSTPKELFESDQIFDSVACKAMQQRMIGPLGAELRNPEYLDSYGTIWGKMYRTDLIKSIKFVDLKIIGTAEDSLFNCLAFKKIQRAIYINQPLYHYRKFNKESETNKYKSDLYKKWNHLFGYIQMAVTSKEGEQALSNRVALSVIGLGLNECASGNSYWKNVARIKMILNQDNFRHALKKLVFTYFPLHWKLFFFFAKFKFYYLFFLCCMCIHYIINRKSE